MYIYRRGGTWWFRKAVPVDLIETLGLQDVRRSLCTASKTVAGHKALRMAIRVQDVYDVLRAKTPQRASREIALSMLREALGRASGTDFGVALRQHELERAGRQIEAMPTLAVEGGADFSFPPFDAVDEETAIWLLRREQPCEAANEAAVELVETVAAVAQSQSPRKQTALLKLESVLKNATLPPEKMTVEAMLQAVKSELRRFRDEMRSRPVSAPVGKAEILEAFAEHERSKWSDQKLPEAIREYSSNRIKGTKKTKDDIKGRLAVFLRVVGDKPVQDIKYADIESYRIMLDELPDRWSLRFKTDDPRVAITRNKERKEPFPTIGKTTVDLKYLRPVRRMFSWLVEKEAIPKNPFDGIKSEQTETTADNAKRIPLRIVQINRLLEETFDSRKLTAFYWIPRLMLFTGARPNELCQLQVEDLWPTFNGRPHLSILCDLPGQDEEADAFEESLTRPNEDDDKGGAVKLAPSLGQNAEADERRVKTLAGKRVIPIHARLIQLGLLEFWRRRTEDIGPGMRVFVDVKKDKYGNFYTALSKRHNRMLRKRCGASELQAIYSLRHNFEDACRLCELRGKMLATTKRKILGHKIPGMGGVYGNPLPLSEESAAIDHITYQGLKLR